MLLRLSVLLATCALAMAAEQPEDSPFPSWLIELGSHINEADTAIVSTRKPRVTGKVRGGTACLNTEECGIGKCCLRRSKDPRRRCKRFQRAGERCTDEQMMGGYYYGHCPCNKRSICMAVNGVLKCVRKEMVQPTSPGPRRPVAPPDDGGKESKESDEFPKRLAPPPKRPNFNETKHEFPEIPEFFKTFGASDVPGPATVPPGEGGEAGGDEGGEEGGEEEGLPNGAEDLPEDISPTRGGGAGQEEPPEPPENSNEGGIEAPPTNANPLPPGGGGGGGMPEPSISKPARPGLPRMELVGLPGSNSVPSLPPPPTLTFGSGEHGSGVGGLGLPNSANSLSRPAGPSVPGFPAGQPARLGAGYRGLPPMPSSNRRTG